MASTKQIASRVKFAAMVRSRSKSKPVSQASAAPTGNAPLKSAPMVKQHVGLGNHKQRFQSHAAVKANAPGSGTLSTGQVDKKEPGKKS